MSDQERIYIDVNPHAMRLIAMLVGFIMGVGLVVLDPWLRFEGIPVRINMQEALLTGIAMAGYGLLLSWMITDFWRSGTIWIVVILTTPLVAGALAFLNELNAILGEPTDLLLLLPIVLVLHGIMVLLTVIYLNIARQLPGREKTVFTAVPAILILVGVLVLGQIRWRDRDAKDVMAAVNQYMSGAQVEDYTIEYLGINYQSEVALIGRTRVHTDEGRLFCTTRIYPASLEVSCEEE